MVHLPALAMHAKFTFYFICSPTNPGSNSIMSGFSSLMLRAPRSFMPASISSARTTKGEI